MGQILSEDSIVTCDRCSGFGRIQYNAGVKCKTNMFSSMCPKCLGKGQVDWIENITMEDNTMIPLEPL